MQANEQLQVRLEALRSQPSALLQAQAKQEEHIRDRDKFKTLIDNLQVLFFSSVHIASCCTNFVGNRSSVPLQGSI